MCTHTHTHTQIQLWTDVHPGIVAPHCSEGMHAHMMHMTTCLHTLLRAVCVQVSYRYNLVKARMQLMQARLADINAMVGVRGCLCVCGGDSSHIELIDMN